MKKDLEWLTLSQAAELLGVHFTTLRRWADQGLIEHIRTPGGKRKFNRKSLEIFLSRYRYPAISTNRFEEIQSKAILQTRQYLQNEVTRQQWFLHLDETKRQNMRIVGHRLIALMFQYCSRDTNGEAFLKEGELIAAEYGQFCKSIGLSLSECIQAFLFFRQPLLNSMHETGTLTGISDQEGHRLFQRLNYFLDRVLIGMVKEYE
jgi:excisionase family DNA binding protein